MKVAAGSNRRVLGPSCTDNFQLVQFVYDGVQYHSCEHAFQAAKFAKGSSLRRKLDAAAPRRSESASMHGLRVWRLGGTRVSGPSAAGVFHPDWDRAKVEVMLSICRAKYAQHPELGQQLLLATGTAEIMGGPSTQWVYQGKRHDWGTWNGRIQTLCREELRPESERDSSLLESLHSLFRDYGVSDEVLVAGCRPQMPCAGGAALPAVKEEPLEPEVAMTVQQRPVCEADIPLILARDAAVYPTEEPLSASTLSELLRQQPSMSSVYYATRAHRHLNGDNRTGVASEEAEADGERDGTVIGFNVCFALRLPSWRLLLEGAISEANVVAGTLSDGTKHRHLATLDPTSNDVDTNVAVHCYHIEKFPKIAEHAGVSAPVLPGFGLTAIRDVRKKLPSKIKFVFLEFVVLLTAATTLLSALAPSLRVPTLTPSFSSAAPAPPCTSNTELWACQLCV